MQYTIHTIVSLCLKCFFYSQAFRACLSLIYFEYIEKLKLTTQELCKAIASTQNSTYSYPASQEKNNMITEHLKHLTSYTNHSIISIEQERNRDMKCKSVCTDNALR